ncbi:ATP synthase protein I [Desulfobotulus alkaliphilus]|uniref:ATP synthase protein I n=1 Tax=Desulfobotulus alkaliphilus TaxID=622671 RepID=A0A562RNY0_9BACT|nr:AtpZ/AtpI family protein [Desulfobotulus alkaliphilus]TWI70772.1 ATP synthase protein I [Desulfobotulus alkaliphilus]
MQKDAVKMMRELATYGSLGMSVAFSVFIGVFAGVMVDRWLDVQPFGVLAGLSLGIAAAFRHILWMIRRVGRT